MKTEILYISDTLKQANEFLTDLVYDLQEMNVPILDFCRCRLVLETEHGIVRCTRKNPYNLRSVRYKNIDYIAKGCFLSEKDFYELIGYRLKPNVQEIQNRKQIIGLLSGELQ